MTVTLFVDPWDPAYGTADRADDGPAEPSGTRVDPDVEVPAAAWHPLVPPATVRVPDVVLFVDGVRRNDARLWVRDEAGDTHPGLAASYAAGAVRCDLRRGAAELAGHLVERGLFTPAAGVPAVGAAPARYLVHHTKGGDAGQLEDGLSTRLAQLEGEISWRLRQSTIDDDDLLVLDGPLGERRALPRAVGYIKTHRRSYLPAVLSRVVTGLAAGQRTPVFGLGRRYSWYLRLPGPADSPWAGVVRVECSADLTAQQAIELADVSACALPRFAASAYKDPRAPQNLTPIAGLERRLRAMLGDPRLLLRTLRRAVAA